MHKDKQVYCGHYSCLNRECKFHIAQITRADIAHDYLNLRGTVLCPLERKPDGKVSTHSE